MNKSMYRGRVGHPNTFTVEDYSSSRGLKLTDVDFSSFYRILRITNGHEPKTTTYKFRGTINFDHLVNDCLVDGNLAFITVDRDKAYMGILQSVNSEVFDALTGFLKSFKSSLRCFDIYAVDKKMIGTAISTVTKCCDNHRKEVKKLARKIHKENNSNGPETKVMVF